MTACPIVSVPNAVYVRVLVMAATDTTSSALARILHLLAQHQDVQEKLRAELQEASPDGQDIPYDQLVDLPYLDAICRETLRVYVTSVVKRHHRTNINACSFSPVTFITRE